MGEAVTRARRGDGPSLIEVSTDRYLGQFQGDAEAYRPQGEVDQLRKNDPIDRLQKQLQDQEMSDAEDQQIRQRASEAVGEAYEFARNSDYPAVSEAEMHVFV